jgi:hypothetical protein
MDRNVANSLEAITSLIYLIRHSLHDPAKALFYLDLANVRLEAITVHLGTCPCASQPNVQ